MTGLGLAAAASVTCVTFRLGTHATKTPPDPAEPSLTPYAPGPEQEPLRETTPASLPARVTSSLVLIPRDQWGAAAPAVTPDGREEHGPYDALTNPNGWQIYDRPLVEVLDKLILHHSALPLTDGPLEIQHLHMEEKGFADIGYHVLIDGTGRLFEGRSLSVRGAHTYGANYGSVGICVLGNFEEIQPAPAQIAIVKLLLKSLPALYPGINRMAGHKDFNPDVTLCPGENFYSLLSGLAQEVSLHYGV